MTATVSTDPPDQEEPEEEELEEEELEEEIEEEEEEAEEELEEEIEEEVEEEEVKPRRGFLKKIPSRILFSPGGVILFFFAIIMEILDPLIPGGSITIEIIPELIFIGFLAVIVKETSFRGLVIPFLIERFPVISDIVPTWLLKMLI